MIDLLKKLGKKEIIYIMFCVIFIICQVWLELKIPDYMSNITKLIQSATPQIPEILNEGSYMLLCAAGTLIFAVIVGYLSAYVATSFSKKIRDDLFCKVENFSMEEMNKFSISSLITRTTNDVSQLEMMLSMGMALLIKAPITAIWAIVKILNQNLTWSAITGGCVIVLVLTVTILLKLIYPNFKRVQVVLDEINNVTRENLKGLRVVRAFNAEKYQVNKFENKNKELTWLQTFNQRTMSILQPMMYLIMNGIVLIIYITGAYFIEQANLTDKIDIFSSMVVFSSYSMQVITSFLMLSMIFMMYPRVQVSSKRIMEVLNSENSIKDGKQEKETQLQGTILFDNVSFKYPDGNDYALKNISFTANQGETVAIVGSTGSGKTTLINLIPRFYDATEGKILVDGIDIKEYKQENLLNKIGYVPQKAVMFSGSVIENIDYGENGKEKTQEQLKKAIEIAQAKDFVEKMDKGYESNISQDGTNLSGGQKQRLAIARAIARNPEICIFDDSFSALDYKTDAKLRKALKEYSKETTSIIVAQRIGTVMHADKILVLDEGKCVGVGTHKELMENCKVYQEIAYSQLSKEELENA